MPAPVYIGDCSWAPQSGGQLGTTEEGLVFYEIPYRGRLDHRASFVAAWPKGAGCPVSEFSQLLLKTSPVVRDIDGVSGESLLRFEGVDTDGSFGEAEDSEEWFAEQQAVTLQPSTPLSRAKYNYLAPVYIYSYTSETRRSTVRGNTKEILDAENQPRPLQLAEWPEKNADVWQPEVFSLESDIASVGEAVDGHIARHVDIAGFTRITREGNGYLHEEMHTRRLMAVKGTVTDD